MRRRDFLLGAGVALAAGPAWAFEREGDRRILVMAGGQAVPVLDPHAGYDGSTRMMQQCVYDALAKYEGDPAIVVPWLAQKWEASGDGLTWTFTLAEGAKFHNGDPVDAEAVRFSYTRALKLDRGVAWMLKGVLAAEGIKAVNPRTVQFTLKQPFPAFLSFVPWWFVVNPKQVLANQAGDDLGQKWLADHEAGSGPFRIKRWDGKAAMTLEAVADYWKGWPQGESQRPAGVIYRVIREPAARKAALERGEADIVAGLGPDDFAALAKNANVFVSQRTGMTPLVVTMNTQKGPCADVNFRKAVAHALDYDALPAMAGGAARLMDSPFPSAIPGHVALPDMPRRNPDLAKQYLAKAKLPQGGVTLEYAHVAGQETERRIGQALADALKPLGIKVNVAALSWADLVARGAKPETTPDLASVYATPVAPDPDAVASLYASSASGQYWGMHHLKDTDLDKLVVQARGETDKARRLALYGDIQRLILADQPAVFCMVEDRRLPMRKNVNGFAFCPVRMEGEVDFYPMSVARTA